MESPIRLYQKQKDYQRHKLFRKIKRRRERERKNAINAPIKELRRRMKQPVRFRGGKDQNKGKKYGYDVEYMSEAEAMKQLADNMNRTAVMDEVVVTPSRRLPMQSELSEGITNQAANERADEYANRTSLTPGRFLGLMGANVPLAAGALGAIAAAPALFNSTLGPLSDYVAGSSIAGIPTTTWLDTALTSAFAGHGLNHVINDGIDGWGDAAMTALEVAPLGRLAKPVYEGVVQPGMRLFNSPLTGNWTKIGSREYRLSSNSLGANVGPIESRKITPEQRTAAQNAAYKNAVMSGNRKKALELLDEAYKRSGVPKTIITMEASGHPKIWYTGSEYGNHTIFDSSKFNATIGGESAVGKIKGNFLTLDLPSAARYAGSGVGEVHEFTEPSTFLEKLQNIFGMYRPERIHPADRIPETLRPKPDRLFTIKDADVIDYLDETDKVVYPMYVNPGERVYTVDFKGNPWSRSPIKFPNSFSIKKTIRDDIAKTYRDEIVPFKDRETAIEYYKSLVDRFGKQYVEDPAKLAEKKFPHPGGDRSIEMFASAPTYEKASLIETHTPATTNGAVQTAEREGYTSVYMPNVIDSNVRGGVPYAIDDFVTLDSRQMKIADITYDDAGELIPLSDRFNWDKLDSRYGFLPIVGMGALKALDKDGQVRFIDSNMGYQKGKDKNLQPLKFQKGTDDNRVQITERTYSKDFLKNAGPDFYKNVKEALKYVPATIGLTVATDSYNRGKDIYIKPSKRGTFTAAAKKRGMSVQQFASKVLKAPKGKYSASMRKKANFAKNASKWKK